MACILTCYKLDIPFYHTLFDSILNNNNTFGIGLYLRQINGRQYQYQDFSQTILNKELGKSQENIIEERETKWTKRDIQNKNRIVDTVLKYDPFEDYDDFSRKFMFNLASDYLSDEETINDPHKLQGVIEIVKMYQQVDTVNKQILLETNSKSINEQRLKTLTAIKKDLLDSINKFAKDNGISASLNNKGNKGSASLAYHVKVLDEIKFTESQVSLYDLATCESFRQFADISNENVLKQIHLNSDELGDMMETQTRIIQNNKLEIMKLVEENRLLKIKLSENNINYSDDNLADASSMEGDS